MLCRASLSYPVQCWGVVCYAIDMPCISTPCAVMCPLACSYKNSLCYHAMPCYAMRVVREVVVEKHGNNLTQHHNTWQSKADRIHSRRFHCSSAQKHIASQLHTESVTHITCDHFLCWKPWADCVGLLWQLCPVMQAGTSAPCLTSELGASLDGWTPPST